MKAMANKKPLAYTGQRPVTRQKLNIKAHLFPKGITEALVFVEGISRSPESISMTNNNN